MEEFQKLPEEFQKEILNRHCSGWALNDHHLANVPTRSMHRTIALTWGGATPNPWENDTNTATFQGMNSAEAFGSAEDANIRIE
ncbi:unnamed protein product [Gongylonema pulchrum]|uniref:SCP domain-containing protein n=1 Tax=Gongylonema pulchrum TaxID=637853 RepID=A0A183CXT0_9BILA|nr:unnamed protein product [Gongylonema pulchrum]